MFHHLGQLRDKLASTVSHLGQVAKATISSAFSARALRSTRPSSRQPQSGPQHQQVWAKLDAVLSGDVLASAVQVWHLQRVLSKILDPATHTSLLDLLYRAQDEPMATKWWRGVVKSFVAALTQSSKREAAGVVGWI